ncbi:hypothetical protein [Virgibacillus halodenitrificans]|uniref:hypothetical protein n=1 Tax=Virgibacillus halodenitrificans TaxID=1482 RepID=UPI000EF4F9B4|nr:hypothetical protein [Virgibacillus halodenitrificans]
MNNNTIIEYITDKKTGKGIRFNRADVETLLFLFEHKLISQNQLYEFYILFKDIHYDSFRKRMNKFAKNKIIQFKRYEFTKKKNGVVKNLILLDVNGFQILYAAGFLSKEQESYEIRTNWDRALATKEVVLQTIKSDISRTGALFGVENKHLYISHKIKSLEQGFIQEKDVLNGKLTLNKNGSIFSDLDPVIFDRLPNDLLFSLPTYKLILPISKEIEIEPDWILGINNNFINFELDAGYRTLVKEDNSDTKSVDELLKEYLKLLNRNPEMKMNILYIYLDDSYPFRKNYGRKIQRIKNFKQKIMDDEEIRESPLNIYVLSLERSENALKNLLPVLRGEQSKTYILKQSVTCITNLLKLDNRYSISHLYGELFHQHFPLAKELIDEVLLINWEENYKKFERVLIPIVVFEGDVHSQHIVNQLSEEIKNNKMKWGLPYDTKVLVIYPNRESMENDVLRDDIVQHSVCLTNMEDIKTYHSTNQPIKLYDITRKGEIPFEDATIYGEV